MLIAAEIIVLGLMIDALHGGRVFGGPSFHRVDANTKTYAPVNAGASPQVEIDDRDSGVTVSSSSDGLVHVSDTRNVHGIVWGSTSVADLSVERTLTGVRISRPQNSGHLTAIIGEDFQRTEIEVPPGTHLRISHCSGADVSDVRNGAEVESQDGRITLTNVQGAIVAHSDDGSIHLRGVTSNSIDAKSADGRIEAANLSMDGSGARAVLHSDDGSIILSGSFAPAGTYDVSTNDGRIELSLAPAADMTVNATTDSGHIYVDGARYGEGDTAAHTVRLGSGSGAMRLATQDGSIHITTNGAT